MPLRLRETLIRTDAPITAAYFPLSGVVSLITLTRSGRTVEATQVGREGMVGLPAFLGADRMPLDVVVQVPGRALAMPTADLKLVTSSDGGSLSKVLKRYTYFRMNEIVQNAACHRLHSLEERAARWLLETAGRVGEAEFRITHEYLAALLGVQRPRVSEALAKFQRDALIESPRQRIRIDDPARLADVACECYGFVRDELRALIAAEAGS